MKNNTQHSPKVKAARNLVQSLQDDLDFNLWLDHHPNGERAANRLLMAINASPVVSTHILSDD